MSVYQQIDALPLDCSDLIYKFVRESNYAKVLKELSSEISEYWEVVSNCMYNDEEYLSFHRTLPHPEPPIINGSPDYDAKSFHDAMNEYLNTYDSIMDEDNYLAEAEYLEAYEIFKYWMQGLRPCYYANKEYMAYLQKMQSGG